MTKYDFSSMSDDNLKEIYHSLNKILGVMSGHFQSLMFDSKRDTYYIGAAIDKFREILKEVVVEIEKREAKPAMPNPEFNF